MRVLLDTNVLLRMASPGHAMHADAVSAVQRIRAASNQPVIVPQVLYEYWVVVTRPVDLNGLGLTTDQARLAVDEFATNLTLLLDERGIFANWLSLVTDHSVNGKLAHDARLVAAMFRHGIINLVTFNKQDFARFQGLVVQTPGEVI